MNDYVFCYESDTFGSTDTEGNKFCNKGSVDELIHPMNNIEWVRNELVE